MLRGESTKWFADTNIDALYISRFDHDVLAYAQSRLGYKLAGAQLYWNGNLTVDAKHQDWANFVETGPGIRFPLPQSTYLTFNALRGRYLLDSATRRPTFTDLRAGFWYAFTR
jgi:hypothetical protein